MRVLLTRPLQAAIETAAKLEQRGRQALVEPLLQIIIEPGPPVDVSNFALLILTSANGADAAAARLADRLIPVLAVGPATASAARSHGFPNVHEADGNGVQGIITSLSRMSLPKTRPLLHISGAQVAGDLQAEAEKRGFTLERMKLYRAHAATELSAAAVEGLKERRFDAVMLFSPRTAAIFESLVAKAALQDTLTGTCACVISENAAKPLESLNFRKVLVAKEPTTQAMLDLLDEL